jgi:competence protein ComEA
MGSRQLAILVLMLLGLAGCKDQSPQQIRENTARATAELKSNAKAVAQGVREGWSRDKPLNLNAASKEQLTTLPGMTAAQADAVIAGRPYDSPTG